MTFLGRFSKNTPISNFTKLGPEEPRCSMQTDGRTDMTKLTDAFPYFAKVPKKLFYQDTKRLLFSSEMEFLYYPLFSKEWIRLFNIFYINNFEYFMKQKISWKADSHSATEQVLCLLQIQKIHYHVHRTSILYISTNILARIIVTANIGELDTFYLFLF
jgi:hypothetical protein